MHSFQADEDFARRLDAEDPLHGYRERFLIPRRPDGQDVAYFCGNSLGLQPARVREFMNQELADWANLAVEAHFHGATPWYSYHEVFRDAGARLVGARPGEVVMMNSLTVNLHLMMMSFYRPTPQRYKIFIDAPTFPSDRYAVSSQIRIHGFDPNEALVVAQPRQGEHTLRMEDMESIVKQQGPRLALVLLSGVNFFTGQFFDLPRLAQLAHEVGAVAGFDLAHAAGNVPLSLHDANADFAVWCSYKYLNSGPGAIAGCFVHERHGRNLDLPRLAGWWGNDPSRRFLMHLLPDFVPREGADGWQLSNPPIFAMVPLRASLELFDEIGMDRLRAKSEKLTGFLEFLLQQLAPRHVEIITPGAPSERGSQLSLLIHTDAKRVMKSLEADGIVCDFREPNVIRVAPVPLYNTFHDVWRLARGLQDRT